MKDFWKTWQFWSVVTAVVLLIVGIVLYIYIPAIRDFVRGVGVCIACALAGFIGGYYVAKQSK